jgi:hypothetical protein
MSRSGLCTFKLLLSGYVITTVVIFLIPQLGLSQKITDLCILLLIVAVYILYWISNTRTEIKADDTEDKR